MKKFLSIGGLLTVLLSVGLLLSLGVNAQTFITGDNVNFGPTETVESTIYTAGRNIDISSNVEGDVFCAGQTVTISGNIVGDVICAAQTISINGNVDGDIRVAAQTVHVRSEITGNSTVGAQTFTLENGARIGGDLTLGSTDAVLNGEVGRDVIVGGASLSLGGEVGRNIKGAVDKIEILSDGSVLGNIDYQSKNDISIADGAQLTGTVSRTDPPEKNTTMVAVTWGWVIYWLLASLFAGLILILFFPSVFQTVTERAVPRPWKALGVGFLASIVAPIVFVFLMITVVGIPIALILGLMWILVMALSGLFSAYLVGRWLLNKTNNKILTMLIGVSVLVIASMIPFIGPIISLAAFWIGVGMIVLESISRTPKPEYKSNKKPRK